MKRTALIVILVLLLGLALTAYLMYTHEMPDQVSRTPEYRSTAKDLLTEFENNVASASTKYLDKIILFSGVLKNVDTTGSIIIGAPEIDGEIIMAIDPRYKPGLMVASTGNTVTVQGICSSYSKDEPSADDMLAGLGATLRFRSGGIKPTGK